jgi:hypothetical protein
LEFRSFYNAYILKPEGSARLLTMREIRVCSGQLESFEFSESNPRSQFVWWCSRPATMARVPAAQAPDRRPRHRLDFQEPVNSRDRAWLEIRTNVDVPRQYRMFRNPATRSRSAADRAHADSEFESIGLLSQGPRFARRFAPGAHLRLEIVLPDHFPMGSIRCRTQFQTRPSRVDVAEDLRLSQLGKAAQNQEGLRRFGTTFTLSVPNPQLDRHYGIEWRLPDVPEWRRWVARSRRREPA